MRNTVSFFKKKETVKTERIQKIMFVEKMEYVKLEKFRKW